MAEFFSGTPAGNPFELFGTAHLVALAIVVAANASIIVCRRAIRNRFDDTFRRSLVAILLADEFLWHMWNLSAGRWTLQEMLPLHLCSVLVFVSSIVLITSNERLYQFVYLLGIAGATQALLTPDIGPFGFPHFRFFQIMLSHGAIVTTAVYMTAVGGLRPTFEGYVRVAVWANIYMLGVGLVNWLLGSNYLFIARKPETASLLDALPDWPWYILYMEGIGLTVALLLFLPFYRRRSVEAGIPEIEPGLSLQNSPTVPVTAERGDGQPGDG